MTTLHPQIPQYLHYCARQKELDPKTIKAYRIDLTQFERFLVQNSLSLNREGINRYLFHLHDTYRQRTVKRKIASLKAFISYLEYEEIIEENPFRKINTRFKEEMILPRSIPRHIIMLLLDTMYKEKNDSLPSGKKKVLIRDIAVIELLFATGLRVSELCALRTEDLDLQNGVFRIKGKGGKERCMQIGNDEVMAAIHEYYHTFQQEIDRQEYFFLNKNTGKLSEQAVRLLVNRHVKEAQIPMHLTPHMFRHAFATLLLEEDVDIRYIQKMLGHSSIVTTQIYTYVANEKQREILKCKHPRNKMSFV